MPRSRRGRRRVRPAVLLSLGAGALLLALAAYCALLFGLLAVSQNASSSGDQARAIAAAEWFGQLSPLERHKSHFNVGTAEAKQSNDDIAQVQLERALQLTPVRDECAVRQNLAYVYEQQAEAFRQDEDPASANAKFDAAKTTLADAPQECRPPDTPQDRAMRQAEERVQESQDEMNAPPHEESQDASGSSPGEPGGEDGSGEGSDDGSQGEDDGTGPADGGDQRDEQSAGDEQPSPGDEKREELRQRQQDSQQRQEESNSRQRSEGSYHDKPW
ncbi:hypothetical protein GCM10022261_03500 [Brevibacterium daeguense]|uniref:Tetratricopeptide repeat protein n=1 Tax=Brevibacterium daeguense TaxID=909936 RepID=A0ABP8EFR8_9MICO|nr:hypothetical protein [Brevibacterium daeguense]